MNQEQRDRVMGRLRSGTADLVVATDVAARGLDIEQLTHVINYDVPASPDAYVHRIGRVGRAGREGVAITLAEPREHRMLKTIERVTKQRISIEQIPTVADLRARRLELTRAALEESILEDDLDSFRVVVESLADEFDVMDVALAAVKLAHEASGAAAAEEEIPEITPRVEREGGDRRPAAEQRRGRPPSAGMTRACSSASAATPESAPRTWLERSQANHRCAAGRSAPSRSLTASPSSRSPSPPSTRSSPRCGQPRSRGARRPSAASTTARARRSDNGRC